MPKFAYNTNFTQEFSELSMLLDGEFDEEAILDEPEGIIFLLTDDPLHFYIK